MEEKQFKICYINYWIDPENDRWWTHFIQYNFPNYKIIEIKNINDNPDIVIASVFGPINNLLNINAKLKIFYYGENLNNCPIYNQNLHLLQQNFHYIIGFDSPENQFSNKIRFPLWFMYYKYYNYQQNDNILTYIRNQRQNNIKIQKNKFASCVARHDVRGQRTKICDAIQKLGKIYYPSKFRNNDINIGPTIQNKIDYIKNTIFNICPENTAHKNYITEKIFHAFQAGTIPIYWGYDLPEIDIINPDSYIFIQDINNIDEQIKLIHKIILEDYHIYLNKNIFKQDAHIIIKKYYDTLIDIIKYKLI